MISLNPQTSQSRYLWCDGEYEIYFTVKESADQYKIYYGGIVIELCKEKIYE